MAASPHPRKRAPGGAGYPEIDSTFVSVGSG